VSLPTVTPGILLVNDNIISKVSIPSTTLSQVTVILALPSVAPALIVTVNELESKSIPDPMRTQLSNYVTASIVVKGYSKWTATLLL